MLTEKERRERIGELLKQESVIAERLKRDLWRLWWFMYRPWLIGAVVLAALSFLFYLV